jgi:hypothetical protein
MTAPVLQSGDAAAWVVRFVMPRGYTLETLPTPNDSRVRLRALPPTRFAVVKFPGLAHAEAVATRTRELQEFISAQRLSAAGAPALARYNPPWTLWFMRRNEIWIPIEAAEQSPGTPAH